MVFLNPFVDSDGDGLFTASVTFLSEFEGTWKEAVLSALDIWESHTNIDFGTHPTAPENSITFAFGDTSGYWGIAYDNDIIFRDTVHVEYRQTLALHEIGHSIGLGHRSGNTVMNHSIPDAMPAPSYLDIEATDALYGRKTPVAPASVQYGRSGSQEVIGNAGSDIIYGNQGSDTLLGRGGADTLYGGQGGDLLEGSTGADILYGNLGNDMLSGGNGADTLFGGQAGDTLWGGEGDDMLHGNLGADLFVASAGTDTVVDFDIAEGDRLSGSASSIAAQDGDTSVAFGDGSSLVLIGINPDDLGSAFV